MLSKREQAFGAFRIIQVFNKRHIGRFPAKLRKNTGIAARERGDEYYRLFTSSDRSVIA